MHSWKLSILVTLAGLILFGPSRAFADDDALSESEISEIMEDVGSTQNTSTSETNHAYAEKNDLENDDDSGVDQEIGQLGSQDALHESAANSRSYSSPIPEAKPEPWMKKESHKSKGKLAKKKSKKKKTLAKHSKKKSKVAKHGKRGKHAVAKHSHKSKDRRIAARKSNRY